MKTKLPELNSSISNDNAAAKFITLQDLKVCDDGALVQILCFWILSIVLFFYLKHRPIYISKLNVSEAGFCLRFQVKLTQLEPIDIASLARQCFTWRRKENISRKRFVLKYRQDGVLDKTRTIYMSGNIIFVPQTFA
jgi:hypothetical protein